MPNPHQRFKFTGWDLENRAILVTSFSILPRSFSNFVPGKYEIREKLMGRTHDCRENTGKLSFLNFTPGIS